ncbi:DNA cytosine methyltransferase [Rhizobium laguerreae]|uniref:DNA cytosine methyltransferase n=1 Tax=Rhizobium laguerreae TaxID=1076926 RepID=UPI001C91C09A|nr:DNA (cytosine-5-)-methyltransferase [Rhizobium laguerreae]MBY3259863.1 DNA cytosine methyltransferase [Rhizobium laguerreae]MBY3282866.1 DNA cytosine methyltransferase [Rhizobium laguerreae]MBY3289220.1 DNA cytosine methyltransferase [Rhizobium laguerreae]
MADIDAKAQALSAARNRILQLQEQMTDKVLQMAAEVEKLMEAVPASEAKAFLKARCNLPAVELATYVGFAKTLKGSEEVLRKSRASFPVTKALVAAAPDVRKEILERMAIGAQIDTKDVAAISRRLEAAKLTPKQAMAAYQRNILAAAARKRTKDSLASFQTDVASFVDDLRRLWLKLLPETDVVCEGLRHRASDLLKVFETLYGAEHRPASEITQTNREYPVAIAYHALRQFRDGQFGGDFGYGLGDRDGTTKAIDALQPFTGKVPVQVGKVRERKPPTELVGPLRPRALELCAGGGGMALGLEQAGYRHVALIEFDRNAAATLRKNRPQWKVVEADIRKIDFTQYRKDRIDLLAGGLPCTPFSSVGERKGKHDDNDLLMEGVRAVKEVQPRSFVFENVEGLLHAKHADYVAALLRKLSKLGYETAIHRINSRDYGIAQNRARILIVGIHKKLGGAFRMPPRFPEMATNMGDVLADLMGANGWSGVADWVRTMQERPFVERGQVIQKGFLSDTIRGYQGSAQNGEGIRALRNGVSYAPPAKGAPTNEEASNEGFVPGLTNRMRSRLQGFPDEWEFVGGLGAVADQVGNAVAPKVAQAVGLAIYSALKAYEIDWKKMMWPSGRRLSIEPPLIDGVPATLVENNELSGFSCEMVG